jgi:hypothetical protein
MKQTKSISEVLNGSYDKLRRASDKSRKWHRKKLLPPAIGHCLALVFFEEMYFVDRIDICERHTTVFIDSTHIGVFPLKYRRFVVSLDGVTVIYENEIEITIIRIN